MKSLMKMSWMEFKLFLRDPASAFFTLVFPLLYLFIFGAIQGNEPSPIFGGSRVIDAAIPSMTAVSIAMAGMMSLTMTLTMYREKGVLRRLRTTPLSPITVLMPHVVVGVGMTFLSMLLLAAAGVLVYHVSFEGNILSVVGGFLLGCLGFFGVGFILAGSFSTIRTAWVVAIVLVYPMLLLSGAFFTVEVMPKVLQVISKFIPMTHVVNLLNGLWVGEPWSQHISEALVLVGLLVVGVLYSIKFFRWEQ